METEYGEVITEYIEHNKALEKSRDYQKIMQEVDKEVYTQFALEHIQMAEQDMAEYGDCEDTFDDEFDAPTEYDIYLSKRSNRIKEAKRLLKEYPDQPIHAARLYMQLGSCHWLWAMKKRILKEKYGIIWYAPSEVYPDDCYD